MRHPRFWAACAFSGAVVLCSCALPFTRLGLRGGDLNAHETVRVISVGTAGAFAIVAAGLALLGVGAVGLRFGTQGPAVLVALVAALVVAAQGEAGLAFSTEDGGILCTAYQASRGIGCGGRLLGPELADLYARSVPSPKTVEQQAEELAYTAAPRVGLWLLVAASFPLVVWACYRAARLRIGNRTVAAIVVAVLTGLLGLLTLLHLAFANYSG
jgi:hypothetical protein